MDGHTQGRRVYESVGTLARHPRSDGGGRCEIRGAVLERREYIGTVPKAERDGQQALRGGNERHQQCKPDLASQTWYISACELLWVCSVIILAQLFLTVIVPCHAYH